MQGMKAHKRVQSEFLNNPLATNSLQAEVALSCSCLIDERQIVLSGRVDLMDSASCWLSEIKSTLVPADKLPLSQIELQWAQLFFYGYMFLHSEQVDSDRSDSVDLDLIHVNLRDYERSVQRRSASRDELIKHAEKALGVYVRWMHAVECRWQHMQSSAVAMTFPFGAFRAGQRDMAAVVYRASRDGDTVLCEAPTGIGKTISALYPAFKSLAEGQVRQVAYLTAKVAGRVTAQQSLEKMQSVGLDFTAIQLRSKQPSCFCSNGRCARDEQGHCPMTIGFFDRLPQARDELLDKGMISAEVMDEVAWQHQLCPFELSQQMLPWVHVVIADYNYVFDPLVRLPHFSMPSRHTVLLIDEAHNLLDRSRHMYSASLSRSLCLQEARQYQATHPRLAQSVTSLAQLMLAHSKAKTAHNTVADDVDKKIQRGVSSTLEELMIAMGERPLLPESSADFFKVLCRFAVIADIAAQNHRCITCVSKMGNVKEVSITLYCVDASKDLARVYKQFKAHVLFSATLRPGTFYRDTLGLPPSASYLRLCSPFNPDNAYRAVIKWIDTRYKQRQASLPALVQLISHAISHKAGNYLVFFPSYAYLHMAYEAFTKLNGDVDTWVQERDQTKQEQADLLSELDSEGHRVGFAIQGGVFGEGIDYIGNRLIGVLVVGTGLPGFDEQTELVSQHYQRLGHNGFDFAYRFPGFTRVLQTAGRLIRHEDDRGFVLLVDSRFAMAEYRLLYPDDWVVSQPDNSEMLNNSLCRFWRLAT